MGFLKSVFRKDWAAELDRAEKLLTEGRSVRALEIARRAERGADESLRGSASLLVDRAERALIDSALAKADAAEAQGSYDDAADWLLAAIDRLGGDPRQGELSARREDLLLRAEDEQVSFAQSASDLGPEPRPGIDLDAHYEALASMLTPEFAPRYEQRPRAFREALVALNEGDSDRALELLNELVGKSPNDGILHLERGRAWLLSGDAARAREDLETAWKDLGDEQIDLIDFISAPSLWAAAAAELGDHEGILRRLAPLSRPEDGRAEICHHYGEALIATGQREPALTYLRAAVADFPGDPRFPIALAETLAAAGALSEAIDCLEVSVAPSCSGAGCSPRAKHLPSIRALADLHLVQGENLDRVPELIAHVAHDQAGHLDGTDYSIMARYYEAIGDAEAAAHSAAEAERAGRSE